MFGCSWEVLKKTSTVVRSTGLGAEVVLEADWFDRNEGVRLQ